MGDAGHLVRGREADRFHELLDAVAGLPVAQDVEQLLQAILDVACDRVGAAYGAMTLTDPDPTRAVETIVSRGERLGEEHETLADGHVAAFEVPIRTPGLADARLVLHAAHGSGGFDDHDQELMRTMVQAVGMRIENALLREQAERQRAWLDAANELATTLLGPISRARALQLVADRARSTAVADFAAVLLPDDTGEFVIRAVAGLPAGGLVGERYGSEHSVAADVARTGRTAVVVDTSLDPRHAQDAPPAWPDLGSLLVLPLPDGTGKVGALKIGWLRDHPSGLWTLDPQVPESYIEQAALVLSVAQAKEDQARLAVLEDRDRIARDLHDLVIQQLFAIGLGLENVMARTKHDDAVRTRISQAVDDLDGTIKDIRRAIYALNAPVADSLDTVIRRLVADTASLLGCQPSFRMIGELDESAIGEREREHLLAVVGEALSNVVRHSGASRIDVELDLRTGISLVVRDDGQGTAGVVRESGLRNLRHRAQELGGIMVTRTAPDSGFELTWTVPDSAGGAATA